MRLAPLLCVATIGCVGAGAKPESPLVADGVVAPASSGFAAAERPLQRTAQERSDDEPSSGSLVQLVRGHEREDGLARNHYAIRVGIGFSPAELEVLEEAVASWARATGLPLHLRHGYGPLGNFHIAETIPVCGQQWVYDGYLGCYSPAFDNVVLNRHGLTLEMERDERLLYVVFVHEIGHFLGLSHAEPGSDSVMLPDYPALLGRSSDLASLSPRDVQAACQLNPCRL